MIALDQLIEGMEFVLFESCILIHGQCEQLSKLQGLHKVTYVHVMSLGKHN